MLPIGVTIIVLVILWSFKIAHTLLFLYFSSRTRLVRDIGLRLASGIYTFSNRIFI